jgi:hypothetical protein
MDKVDRVVTKLEMRTTEEQLDGTPYLSPYSYPMTQVVNFGNTGFNISFGLENNIFNFTPEGRIFPEKQNAARYASALCVSLLELHNFLNNPEKIRIFGINESEITKVSANTNPTLRNAIEELFSKSIPPNIASKNENEKTVSIDLQSFKSLGKSDPLIKYLSRVSKRAKNTSIRHTRVIECP